MENNAIVNQENPSTSSFEYCFLCLAELTQTPETEEDVAVIKNLGDKKNRYYIATKYLIHSCTDTKDSTNKQLELINKLLAVLKLEYSETGQEFNNFSKSLCLECEKKVTELVKLHKSLELIQLKLGKTIKAIQSLIIGSSVYGSDDFKKKEMEKLETWLQEQEGLGNGHKVKKKREWLEVLLEFHTTIFNKSEESNEDMCPYLNKCHLVPPSSSVFEQEIKHASEILDSRDAVATEPLKETDFLVDISSLVKAEFSGKVAEDEDEICSLESFSLELNELNPDFDSTTILEDTIITSGKRNRRTREAKKKHTKDAKNLHIQNPIHTVFKKRGRRKRRVSSEVPQEKDSTQHKYATRMAIIVDKDRRLRIYKCEICNFGAPSMYTFIHHLRSHETNEKVYECKEKICADRMFSGAQFFKLHQLQHQEGQYQWKCKVCLKRVSPSEYSKHLKTHGDGPVFQCEYCYYASRTVADFVSHLRYHHGVTPKCLFCDATIPKVAGQSAYAQHLHKEHGRNELVVPCDFEGCKETFYSSYAMHLHKNIHMKKFHCEKCTRSFSTSTAYRMHVQERHTKEKVHPCTVPDCKESFVTHPELERHLVGKHNMPKFRCSICPDREYSNMRSLKVHERRHHQENLYSCDICGKEFKNISYCNKHKTIHGPRNVICEVCGFATTSHYQLQKHKVIHKEVPLHGCPHCPKRFNYRRAMEDHIRTHTGEKPFVCHVCSAAFAQKGACMNHIRKLHEKDNKKQKNNVGTSSQEQPESESSHSQEGQGQIVIDLQPAQLDPVITTSNTGEITYDILQAAKMDGFGETLNVQTFSDGTGFNSLT